MAAKKKDEETEEESSLSEAQKHLKTLFKDKKDDHYNFEDTIYYKVPSSSMTMNAEMGGGMEPGAHRFIGAPAGGKTSAALDYMKHFLGKKTKSGNDRRGIYFRCEGRLSPNMQARSGVTFVTKEEDWLPGTCMIVDSNIFEFVFDMIRTLIQFNKEKCKFFFILDSLDMMIKREDAKKPFEESGQVAGGALLTSVFFKKVSIALTKRGHIAILMSQIRDSIKIDKYTKENPRQGSSSGGHATEHAAGWVLEFLPRFQDDIIREGGLKTGKPVGHFAKCKVVKSDNESYLREIRYPICYQRTNGNSVWVEKELFDMLLMWEQLYRPTGAGAWYSVREDLYNELIAAGLPVETKYQGEAKISQWLQDNPPVVEFLVDKFLEVV